MYGWLGCNIYDDCVSAVLFPMNLGLASYAEVGDNQLHLVYLLIRVCFGLELLQYSNMLIRTSLVKVVRKDVRDLVT